MFKFVVSPWPADSGQLLAHVYYLSAKAGFHCYWEHTRGASHGVWVFVCGEHVALWCLWARRKIGG